MMIKTFAIAASALTVFASATQANAQVVADFTGSAVPSNYFAAFNDTNAVPGADGITIDLAASGDNFGGVGFVGLVGTPTLTPGGTAFVTAKLGAGNDSDLIVAFREDSNEFFSYAIPASSFNESTFTTVEFSLDSFFFNGDVSDATPNGSIIESTVQSPFGSGNAFSYVVANTGIVPEPASLGLLAAGAGLIGLRRRR